MADYRTQEPKTAADLETIALLDLAHRMKRLRGVVAKPAAVAAIVAGHLGLAAHIFGYWSALGVTVEGEYGISAITLLVALLVPMIPLVAAAALVYRVAARRLQRAWCDEHASKGVPRAVLERSARRYG